MKLQTYALAAVTACVGSAASLVTAISSEFALQVQGFDQTLNGTFVTPKIMGDKLYYGFSGQSSNDTFITLADQLFYKAQDRDDTWWFASAKFGTTPNLLPVLIFSTTNGKPGFAFDTKGRLQFESNQWGWYACKDTGDVFSYNDQPALAFWDNQSNVDFTRCKPVTLHKVPRVKSLC